MKLRDFLDVADEDDMVEVYADDGATRPCEIMLVDAFQMSDWTGGVPDVKDELEAYLDREVTGVAPVKLDGCGCDVVVAMRVYVKQKGGDKDVRNKGVRNGGHGQVKKVVGVLVHEHSVPELVIWEIPEGHGSPANLVVLPGIEAPDTDKLGGDDNIGFDLAGRLVSACVAVKKLRSSDRSVEREHLRHARAILCGLVALVRPGAAVTVPEESVEALIHAAIDRVQLAEEAMGFKLGEVK